MARGLLRFNPALTAAPAQVQGVNIPKGIDPVSQIEERNAAEMSQKFDKMATFAANQQIKTNVAEATKFGAANAPTQDQISLAMENGKPLTAADLPGDITGNVVEQAAAKSALAVAESRSTAAARRDLTQVYVDGINNPDMTPGQLVKNLDDVTASWAEALKTLDPLSSAKVEASLATTSTSMLQTYSRTWATNQKIAGRSAGIAAIPEHISGAVQALQAGPAETRGAGGKAADAAPVTTKQMIALKKNDMLNQMTLAGNTAAQKKAAATRFDKAILEATSGAVGVYILEQAGEVNQTASYKRLERAISGKEKLDSHHHQSLLNSMSGAEKLKLLDEVRTRAAGGLAIRKAQEDLLESTQKDSQSDASSRFYELWRRGEKEEALKQLEFMDEKEALELSKRALVGDLDLEREDPAVVDDLDTQAGFLGNSAASVSLNIATALGKKQITYKTAASLRSKVATLRKGRMAIAVGMLKNETVIDPAQADLLGDSAPAESRRYVAIYKKATAEMLRAQVLDPNFNPIDWVETKLGALAIEETKRIQTEAFRSLSRGLGRLRGVGKIPEGLGTDIITQKAFLTVLKGMSKNVSGRDTAINRLQDLIDATGAVR